MAKFSGFVGYATLSETTPGVWTESMIEKRYYGDVIRNTRRLESKDRVNDDVEINNSISIVGDAYAWGNIFAMRYVTWMGAKWKIANVEVQRPRLILTIGGVWNGNEA